MSISRIVREVENVRGNNEIVEGVIDTIDVLNLLGTDFGDEISYWLYAEDVWKCLDILNEKLMEEDEDDEDWIWKHGSGEFYMSAEKYNISNDISGSCYSNEKTGDNGVIVVLSVKLDEDKYSSCCAIYFDISYPNSASVEFLIMDAISELELERI